MKKFQMLLLGLIGGRVIDSISHIGVGAGCKVGGFDRRHAAACRYRKYLDPRFSDDYRGSIQHLVPRLSGHVLWFGLSTLDCTTA
jgi:hypothetical protein